MGCSSLFHNSTSMRFLHLSLDGQVVSTERYLRAVLSRATVVAEAINTIHEKVTNSYTTQ